MSMLREEIIMEKRDKNPNIGSEECPHENSGKGCPVDDYLKCTRDNCKYGPVGKLFP